MIKKFREALLSGETKLGFAVMYPAPGIIECVGPEWDWIFIDGQHGELDYSDILQLIRACNLIERPAIVRVASHEYGVIGRVLDGGANGVIVPMVNTEEEAVEVVESAKFPPCGERSIGGRRVVDRKGRNYVESANEDTLLIVQIETPAGLENADRIAALEGVDALFLGPADMMLRRECKAGTPEAIEALREVREKVAAVCRKHSKIAAIPAMNAETIRLCRGMGYHLLGAAADSSFLANASHAFAGEARSILEEERESIP